MSFIHILAPGLSGTRARLAAHSRPQLLLADGPRAARATARSALELLDTATSLQARVRSDYEAYLAAAEGRYWRAMTHTPEGDALAEWDAYIEWLEQERMCVVRSYLLAATRVSTAQKLSRLSKSWIAQRRGSLFPQATACASDRRLSPYTLRNEIAASESRRLRALDAARARGDEAPKAMSLPQFH